MEVYVPLTEERMYYKYRENKINLSEYITISDMESAIRGYGRTYSTIMYETDHKEDKRKDGETFSKAFDFIL